MPDLDDLLERAAPAPSGPVPFDAIVQRGRRRGRTTKVLVAGAALLAVLVAASLLPDPAPRLPVVDDGPDDAAEAVTVTTACGEFVVPQSVAEYLDDWTGGSRTLGEVCVLEALGGPEPEFDVTGLGDEQVWLDDDLDRGRVEPPDHLDTDGYPVVYIGTTALPGDATLRSRLVRSWGDRPGAEVFWCTSTPATGSGCGPKDDDIGGALVSSRRTTGRTGGSVPDRGSIQMLVPENTAVAVLTIDGEPVAWQRPRGRTVLITAPSVQRFTVTAYDAAGSVIDEYSAES
jgi:hypothetical protein